MRFGLLLALLLGTAPTAAQRGAIDTLDVATRSIDTGRALSLTVRGTNPCGAVEIDPGDGHVVTHPITGLPATVTHTYLKPGRYDVRARGMGNCDGRATAAITVTGEELPDPERREEEPARERDDEPRRRPAERRSAGSTTVTLNPTARWTETDIYVDEGDQVHLRAWGSVVIAPRTARVGPDGARSARVRNAPFPDRPAGALIAKVGQDGEPIFVGRWEHTFRAPRSGNLWFGVNDDRVEDNAGSMSVRVTLPREEVGTSGRSPRSIGRRGDLDNLVVEREVQVPADRSWTDTGIALRVGDLLSLEASGSVRLTGSRWDTADAGGSRTRVAQDAPFPNRPTGALIARIGRGEPIFVGAHQQAFRVMEDGVLWLGINDDYLRDNSGDFLVVVRVHAAAR